MSDAQRDVVEVLTHDHREVEDLFSRVEAVSSVEQKADLVEQVTIELVRHSVAEEQWLYPAVRDMVAGGDKLADQEIAEHAEVEGLLKDLERMKPDEAGYSDKVASLIVNVRQHVVEEEGELFPKLVAAATPEQLRDLGSKIETAKKVAPTRPHPSSPSEPPANKILAPGVGMIDRLRDALSGRG